jgi:hypothetical protein
LAGVLARAAARLLTSSMAFLIAGVIDVLAYGVAALRRQASSTMARR